MEKERKKQLLSQLQELGFTKTNVSFSKDGIPYYKFHDENNVNIVIKIL